MTLASGCTSKDQYGSNDCTLAWGSNNTVKEDIIIAQTLTAASKFSYDVKVGILPLKGTDSIIIAHPPFTMAVYHCRRMRSLR